VSAFVSWDTSFGLETDAAMLARMNLSWRGEKHTDEFAASDIDKAVEKKDLQESPSVKFFVLGANNEGCWGHNHMVTQLEDCVACLKLACPNFDFAFLFDHSSGHSKNSGFGGPQLVMRDSVVLETDV
jgi:hypothetical protein